MQKFICNAFSPSMVPAECSVEIKEITPEFAAEFAAEAVSAVGLEDAVRAFAAVGVTVALNRTTVKLYGNDVVVVGIYSGPRLPPGAVSLPEGAEISWRLVRVLPS